MKLDDLKTPLHLLTDNDAMQLILAVRNMRRQWTDAAKSRGKQSRNSKEPKVAKIKSAKKQTKITADDIKRLMAELNLKGFK